MNRMDFIGLNSDNDSSWMDKLHVGLDIAGAFEPTPIADLLNALIYTFEGNESDAIVSLAGVVPYIGDGAKAGRLGIKAVRSVRRGYKTCGEAAEAAARHGWRKTGGRRHG